MRGRAARLPLTSDDWLPVFESHLTAPLFEPGALARLRALLRELPGTCFAIIEARLAPGRARLDLSLHLQSRRAARLMAGRISPPHLATFLSRWSAADGPLAGVRSLWLEFDLDDEPRGLPVPTVCAKLPSGVSQAWVLSSLLPAMHGRALSARQKLLLGRCLGEMPPTASLLYVFSLLSREGRAVRIELFGLDPGGIADYLRRVAPHVDPRVAEPASLLAGVERIHLSLDLAAEISPRIGIEGSFARLPQRDPRWTELFTRLVARGLCCPVKRDAILAWPGYDTFWTAAAAWPLAQAGAGGFCVRSLSHVKLVCQPDGEPEAKAYLVFGRLPARASS